MIDSNIPQADEVVIDGRKYKDVSFPMSVKVKRGFNESVVTGKAEGYEKSTIQVEKVFHTLAILNLCDIFGWAIDAATGAMMKPEYNDYELEFVKEKQ